MASTSRALGKLLTAGKVTQNGILARSIATSVADPKVCLHLFTLLLFVYFANQFIA